MYLDCQNVEIVSWISTLIIANVLEYMKKAHLRSDFWQSKYTCTYYKSVTLVEGKNSCTALIMNGLYQIHT